MITTDMTTTAPGENSIVDLNSSKYLVNPPCPEGNLILLSAILSSNSSGYKYLLVRNQNQKVFSHNLV